VCSKLIAEQNLSAVDIASNTIIGDPLITWADWPISGTNDDSKSASHSRLTIRVLTYFAVNFNTTIPESLAEPCAEAGTCILQWYWWSDSNSQTYISCLDFYVTA
jgi:hypothetical protein